MATSPLTPRPALRNQLGVRLFGAFALVITVGILVTVLLTREGANAQFAHLMVDGHVVQPGRLRQNLVTYYVANEGWAGLAAAFDPLIIETADGTMRGMMNGMMGGMMGTHNNRLQVRDSAEQIVADTAPTAGELTAISRGWSIVVEGRTVGTLVAEGTLMSASNAGEGALVQGITRAVLIAGIIAGVLGLALAGILVRQITQPLAGLTAASSRIAQGDLTVRVPTQSHDELGRLATTFNQMATALETQEELRRNLMADVAHELRTPLAAIQGTVEALQDGIFPADAANLGIIHDEVLLLNRLVDDLRTLANAEAGKLTLHLRPINLGELAERQVVALRYRAVAAAVDVTLQQPLALPLLTADEQRLGQVLTNLLDNALRHTPAGGVITLTLAANATSVIITVTDSGEGIAPADLPHVFDRFYRADPARTRASGGSGLGLAIVRELVEAHGGAVTVLSPPPRQPQGASFTVTLPVGQNSLTPAAAPPANRASGRASGQSG